MKKERLEALVEAGRRVQEDIERHQEMYSDDAWDEFAGVNGLTDKQLEKVQEQVWS